MWKLIERDKKRLNWKNTNLKKSKRWNKFSWFSKTKVTIKIIRIKRLNRQIINKDKE